jgi:hypothetical protein
MGAKLVKLHKEDILLSSPVVGVVRFTESKPASTAPYLDDEGLEVVPQTMWRVDCLDSGGAGYVSVPYEFDARRERTPEDRESFINSAVKALEEERS